MLPTCSVTAWLLIGLATQNAGADELQNKVAQLHDADPKVRLQAAIDLGKMRAHASKSGRKAVVTALVDRLQDEDEAVCRAAATTLGGRPDAMPELCHALGSKDARVRRWSAFALGEMAHGMPGGLPAIFEMLPAVRSQASAAIPSLLGALNDTNAQVRAEVLSALGAIGPAAKTAVPKIARALKDRDKIVRRTAAAALWYIDHQTESTVAVLADGLQDTTAELIDRQACADVLGRMGARARAAVPALITAMRGVRGFLGRTEADVELSFAAADTLAHIGEPAVPALIVELRGKDSDVRKHAAWACWKMGLQAKEAVPALCEMCRDTDAELRIFAVNALGKIGPSAKSAVPALVPRLKDSDGKVRRAASWALGRIGSSSKRAVPALIVALGDKQEEVKEAAAWALGRIGSEARAAVPALVGLINGKSETLAVRQAAREALKNIGPE